MPTAAETLRHTVHRAMADVQDAGRFVLSIKSECLSKLVLLGENHLRRAVSEYVEHYHRERNHQGVGNRLLTPAEPAVRPANGNAPVERRERLGGLLNFYCRPAA